MLRRLFAAVILAVSVITVPSALEGQASPYSVSLFAPQTFTATAQTGTPIQLNGLTVQSTVGSSFASANVTITGSSLTTATWAVQGSSDNGVSYFPVTLVNVSNPASSGTTVTSTSDGLYRFSTASLTHVRFVTSGTFTASSISLRLSANPNAPVADGTPGGAPTAGQIASAIQSQSGCNTAGYVWIPQSNTCVSQSSGSGVPGGNVGSIQINADGSNFGGIDPTSRTDTINNQLVIESTNASTAFGAYIYSDSNGANAGVANPVDGWTSIVTQDWGIANSSNVAPNNYSVAGDNAQDLTYRMLQSPLNPGDSGVPIVITAIGTNGAAGGSGGIQNFNQAQMASMAWASISSNDKVLTSSLSGSATGTWTAYNTYPNANGLSSSTSGSTIPYTAQVGPSGVFYVLYGVVKAGPNGIFTVTDGASLLTDTNTGSTSVNSAWSVMPNNTAGAVGVARFVTTPGQRSLSINYVSGTVYPLAYMFSPTKRYRGMSSPRVYAANVPPQQNDASATNVKLYGAATFAAVQQLVKDGLNANPIDLYNRIDPIMDMTSVTIRNCTASNNPGLHYSKCGHRHAAQIVESAVNAVIAPPNSNIVAPLNTNGIPSITNLATQANGLDNNTYTSGGTTFPKGSLCVMTPSGFCWGITANGSGGGPYRTILMANTGSGRISMSFAPAGATPTQTISGITAEWLSDGSATLAPNVTVSSTATSNTLAGKKATFTLAANAATVADYHVFNGVSASTSSTMGGVNVGTNVNSGIHMLRQTALGLYSTGVYSPTSQVHCSWFYTGSGAFADFTCPAYTSSDGVLHTPGTESPNSTVVASASTVVVLPAMTIISGVASIDTLTAPTGYSITQGGCIDILATGAWSTTTSGNIFAIMTAVPNTTYRACYFAVSGVAKWYIK